MFKNENATSGYEIDVRSDVVALRVWGLFNDEMAERYCDDLVAAFRKVAGGTWYVLADISQFPPQKPHIQEKLAAVMVKAGEMGMKKAANVVDRSLNKMQIKRLSVETGLPDFAFHTEEHLALNWLRQA